MALSPEDIRALISAFQSSDWDEMSLQYGDTRLDLTRNGHPPVGRQNAPVAAVAAAPAAAPAASNGPTSVAHPDGQKVTSPSLGLFWRSPQPGAPSFVEVGQQVDAEDTVCIVEVMKLMNHVKAGVSGKVVAILVDNGAMVEFGQTLVVIEPGA